MATADSQAIALPKGFIAQFIIIDKTLKDQIVAEYAALGVLTDTEDFIPEENPDGGGMVIHIAGTEEQLAKVFKIEGVRMMTGRLT